MLKRLVAVIAIFFGMARSVLAYTEAVVYQYDDLNRLTSAQSGQGIDQTFSFDEVYNRLSTSRAAPLGNAPTAVSDNYTLLTGTTLNVPETGVLANDIDAGNQVLTVSNHFGAKHGNVTLHDNGSFSYTPNTDYVGEDYFSYQVTNGSQSSNFATVHLTVSPTHPYPVAQDDTVIATQGVAMSIPVLANDIDSSASGLTISQIEYSGQGNVSNSGSSLSYQASNQFVGKETLSYTITDGFGGTSTAQVSITVNDQNFAPVVTNEVVWVTAGKLITIPVLANDFDLDKDTLTITQLSYSGSGSVSHDGTTISFTPPSDATSQTITYTVSDGTVSQTGQVTVYLVTNDSPTARNDSYTTLEDMPITLDVLSNDTDPEDDPLTIVSTSGASHGGVSIVGDQLHYAPSRNYYGLDSFTYIIRDTQGLTDQAMVSITVTRDLTNDPPVAVNDRYSTPINTAKVLDVLSNDTDVDRDTLSIKSFTASPGAGGTVTRSGKNLIYTPPNGFIGRVTFNYIVQDGKGGEDIGMVSVTVYKPGTTIVPILKLLLLNGEEAPWT